MKKKIIAMVLGMAVCVGQAEAFCPTDLLMGQCNIRNQFVADKCNSELEAISKQYENIINYLNNEMIKQSQSGGKYKANTSVSMPNWKPDTLVEGIIAGITIPDPCCWVKIDVTRNNCKANAYNIKNSMEKAIQELIKTIQDQYNRYQQDFNSSTDPGDTSGSSSSSNSTSSTTSGSSSSSSSNYNPYGSSSSSGGSVSRSAGANDNQDFNAFKSKVKQGANEDNNIVKGKNQSKSSASQGDTSFYDVVGERPPASKGIRD